jgi:2-C-methyl-D-erythritol 2,4-cyclodiphosphate synthase
MIERISKRSQRAFIYALEEARSLGSNGIELEQLLFGLSRENPALFQTLGLKKERIMQSRTRAKERKRASRHESSQAISMGFSEKFNHVLKRAGEEADQLGHKNIGTAHLLYALFQEDPKLRAKLKRLGVTAIRIRDAATEEPVQSIPSEYWNPMRRYAGRSGIGYDLHRLEAGRKLKIGGVEVPFDKGSVGHSDGDVLAHAICDALLGAAGLGDIGKHFPDTDPKWKGADSLVFLKHVHELYEKDGLRIFHIDAIVIAERPKLGPYFPAMREALAGALGMKQDHINLKAKTNEGVDAIGRGEAIAAHAVATIAG